MKKIVLILIIVFMLNGCEEEISNEILDELTNKYEEKIVSLEEKLNDTEKKYEQEIYKAEILSETIENQKVIDDEIDSRLIDYYKEHFESTFTSEESKKVIFELSDEVMRILSDNDYQELTKYIHPTNGVRFTPYTNVDLKNDIVFTNKELMDGIVENTIFPWGIYDGKGGSIEMSIEEYFDNFVYDIDYIEQAEVGYNQYLNSTGWYENQYAIYHNSIIVEYYIQEVNPDLHGLDWKSLRIVYQVHNEKWYIVGFIHNQWTP